MTIAKTESPFLSLGLSIIVLCGSVLMSFGAQATDVQSVLRLDPMSQEEKSRWALDGFNVIDLACDSPTIECIRKSLSTRKNDHATLLIATAQHSQLVKQMYENGFDKNLISHIILLGVAQETSLPTSANKNAPDFLVFADKEDPIEEVVPARKFSSALREFGVRSTLLFAPEGLMDRDPLDRLLTDIIFHFIGRSPFNEQFNSLLDAYTDWQTPPFDHADLSSQTEYIQSYEMTDQVEMLLKVHFGFEPHLIKQWPLETFRAFDLIAYQKQVAPDAKFITLRNIREQVIYLDLEQYGQYEPVIIVGIDDETNLYRMAWFYRTKAMYSWKADVPKLSARLLGPFVYFRKPIPEELQIPVLLRSALSLDGITFSEDDPLESIKEYPAKIQKIITTDNKCVYCHEIGGVGGRYHHIEAATAEPQGGVAIPLEAYPDFVMDAFLYDQVATAKKIGMTPNPLADDVVEAFDKWYKTLPKLSDPEIE